MGHMLDGMFEAMIAFFVVVVIAVMGVTYYVTKATQPKILCVKYDVGNGKCVVYKINKE